MRFTTTIVGLATAACFAMTAPVYAGSQGHSGSAPGHNHAPAPAPSSGGSGKSTTTGATTTTTTTTTTAPKTTLNPIAAKIASKPQLNGKVTAMLPKNTTLDTASLGFKNQGQFIAALHVSQNLGIPFKALKKDMVDKNMSLGQSIQDLKKSADSTSESKKAEHEADHDMDDKPHHPTSIAGKISSNPQLDAKVTALLPAGMSLQTAAKGFRSESQFLAALHASKDLNIPFTQIKAEMTGHDHDSLTTAIQEIKPGVNAASAAKTAETEAAADIKSTATHTDHDGDAR